MVAEQNCRGKKEAKLSWKKGIIAEKEAEQSWKKRKIGKKRGEIGRKRNYGMEKRKEEKYNLLLGKMLREAKLE